MTISKLAQLGIVLSSLTAGGTLAWQHPLWPLPILLFSCIWSLTLFWRPNLWLFAVPAALPLLNFAPWTGWLMVDEFDIFLLASLAGGYASWMASPRINTESKSLDFFMVWITVIGLVGLWGLFRGFADAGTCNVNWFADYAEATNSLRVFKSLGFALLFAPLLRREIARDQASACRLFASGMVAGLTIVVLATLWERVAFPGLIDFSSHYRTVALFWEMHVGGAAIDTYLALSSPFAVWALVQARHPLAWLSAAVLALLVVYADLTTFARGVYLGVAAPLMVLGVLLWIQAHDGAAGELYARVRSSGWLFGWRGKAGVILSIILVLEVVAVLVGGDFMTERLSDTSKDFGSRLQHWKSGLGLLKSMQDKLLGIGLGRLPSNYAARVPAGEFGGEVRWHIEQKSVSPPSSYVTLSGPKTRENMGGSLELTQRVHPARADLHRVKLTVRVQNDTPMELYLCERHLLYDHTCQSAHITLMPEFIGRVAVWQHLQVDLEGLPLSRETGFAPRLMMFSLGILNAGSRADISQVGLFESDGASLLINGDFLMGPARWFPAVQSHFEPWHLDNLYLEVLVERGILGLLSLLMPLAYVMWRLVFGCARRGSLSAYVVASLLGVLLVGLVSSVMDVPRVAFIFFMLTLVGSQVTFPRQSRGAFKV